MASVALRSAGSCEYSVGNLWASGGLLDIYTVFGVYLSKGAWLALGRRLGRGPEELRAIEGRTGERMRCGRTDRDEGGLLGLGKTRWTMAGAPSRRAETWRAAFV